MCVSCLEHGQTELKLYLYFCACVNVNARYPLLESIVSQPNTLLMWPGREAEDLKSFLARQSLLGATDNNYTLIILDGTWHQARSLYNQNTFLHSLKQAGHLSILLTCKCY